MKSKKKKDTDSFDILGYADTFDFCGLAEKQRVFAACRAAWLWAHQKW